MNMLREKIIIFLGVIGVSLSGIFAKLYDAPSIYIVMMRLLFTVMLMSVPYIMSLKSEYSKLNAKVLLCSAVGGFVLAFHFFCFFESVRLASVASGTLLINTSVFFVPIIMHVFFGERLSKNALLGIVITFIGSAIVAMGDSRGGSDMLLGDALAVFGAFCEAVYMIMGMLCRRTLSTTAYTGTVYSFAALTAFIIVLLQGIPLTGYGIADYGSALGMAVFCTVFSRGLKYVSPSFVSTTKLAEPVFAAVFAFFLFHEDPTAFTVIGGAVIIFGVIWTVRYQN